MAGQITHKWNGTILTITSDSGTSSCDLKGQQGDIGIRGPQGIPGEGVGIPGKDGEPGKDGVGVANIYQKTTSLADGGENVYVIELTDGTISNFKVRNGSKGSKGDTPSLDGYATEKYVDDVIANLDISGVNIDLSNYYTKSETNTAISNAQPDLTPYAKKTEIPSTAGLATEDYVDDAIAAIPTTDLTNYYTKSQTDAAIAAKEVDLSAYVKSVNGETPDASGNVVITATVEQPQFVESVDDMEDESKAYVLTTDGYIYTHKTITIPGETTTTYPNQLVASTVELNKRYSGSSQSTTVKQGYFVTDFIAVPNYANTSPYNMRLSWEVPYSTATDVKIAYFNTSKSYLGMSYIAAANTAAANGTTITDLRTQSGGTAPTASAVAYVRIQLAVNSSMASLTAADIANLTITFDAVYETESTETITKQEWVSTGIAYNKPADYEGRILNLESDMETVKTDIFNLQNASTGSTATEIPVYWNSEVEDTITKIKALQQGRNCITFPFFSDNHQRNGYAGILIKRVMDECHIPYCFYGGDSISNGTLESEAEMIAQDKAFDAMLKVIPNGKVCRAVGNHDGYWKTAAGTKHTYTQEQIYELFLREESTAQTKQFGDGGTYYYVDDVASKVRFIVMDTNRLDEAAQITWLSNTALQFNNDGWAVVLIAHHPITEHYATVINNAADVRTVLKNYISGSTAHKADIVGWFNGHIHRDRIFKGVAANPGYDGSTDTETDAAEGNPISEELPWKTVSIISDNVAIGYGGVKHAIDNSNQSHAIDFITINKTTKKVNLTRLGFGEDREYSY